MDKKKLLPSIVGVIVAFCDDQKPSQLQEYRDDLGSSQGFMLSAVGRLLSVKSKLGLISRDQAADCLPTAESAK